jgi:hypothetical protein
VASEDESKDMKVSRNRIVAIIFLFVLAFLFLVPVIYYPIPTGHYSCPTNGYGCVEYGSVTYWGLGVGGTLSYGMAYTIAAAPSSPVPIQPSTSSTSSTCSGYPPGGDCIADYSYTFTVSVNYSGSWKLTYQGYNSLGKYNPTGVSGSYNGTGFYSVPITLTGLNNGGLTLCAQAQKLDASTTTLILTVTGFNETSVPYGSTSYCGVVAP